MKDILDFRHIQLESEPIEKAITICLFKDGQIEIYWNRKLIQSPLKEEGNTSYESIYATFNDILLTKKKSDGQQNVDERYAIISLSQGQRIDYRQRTKLQQMEDSQIQAFTSQKYNAVYKPFQSIIFFDERFLLIAHGHILSCYDGFYQKWLREHLTFAAAKKKQVD